MLNDALRDNAGAAKTGWCKEHPLPFKIMQTLNIRTTLACICLALVMSGPAPAQSINFGDDNSEFANDGECDDRRFTGPFMASSLDVDDIGHDATDCRRAFDLDQIKLLNETEARAATQCRAIKFGLNTSEWANDRECDDPRFEGPGTSSIMMITDVAEDAFDCQRACEAGTIYLRDY